MICPGCGKVGVSIVFDTRNRNGKVYRRRECTICGRRFTTIEEINDPDLKPRKRGRKKGGKTKAQRTDEGGAEA